MMMSFDYNYQNPSIFLFLGLQNLNNKEKQVKEILVVVVKSQQHANLLLANKLT